MPSFKTKYYPGKVSIHRRRGQHDEEIVIQFEDAASGVAFASAVMSAKHFGYAVTGAPKQPARMEYRRHDLVGRLQSWGQRYLTLPDGMHSWKNREAVELWAEERCRELERAAAEDGAYVEWMPQYGTTKTFRSVGGREELLFRFNQYINPPEADEQLVQRDLFQVYDINVRRARKP